MKQALLFILTLMLLLGGSVSAGTEENAFGSASSARDSSDRTITILLPELERRASNLDENAETQDLVGALSVARGYLELGLHAEASEWYERVENLDGTGLFGAALFHGRLTMAAQSGDADSLEAIITTYGDQVENPDVELLVSALTNVGRAGSWEDVDRLAKSSMALFGEQAPSELVYLQGRALRRQGQLVEAIYHFERQLNAMKVPAAVHPSLLEQKGRFLRAAADCSFLMNDRLRARGLYQRLIKDGDAGQREWGQFQVAQLDMLANDYQRAEATFRALAFDTLGTLAEAWAGALAEHCLEMRAYQEHYFSLSPRLKTAMP